jgi:hypothetical protein
MAQYGYFPTPEALDELLECGTGGLHVYSHNLAKRNNPERGLAKAKGGLFTKSGERLKGLGLWAY